MAKLQRDEPRRVESPARVTVAGAEPGPQGQVMRMADAAPIPPMQTVMVDDGVLAALNCVQPMSSAPQDGSMIDARTIDGSDIRAVWRRTSHFDRNLGRWVQTGFWSNPMNREPIKMELVGWKVAEGFMAAVP